MTGLVILGGSETLTPGTSLLVTDTPPAPEPKGPQTEPTEGAIGDAFRPDQGARTPIRPQAATEPPPRAAPVTFQTGIPSTVLAAYKRAEGLLARTDPSCHLGWPLLAGIGQVESGHARGGDVDAQGNTRTPILGPRLDGVSFALIRDTDGGRLDGDTAYDRAVGPMQFIPGSWSRYASDGNGDGRQDPNNVYDATLATGRYLCQGDRDLRDAADRHDAVYSYNHSEEYVRTVLAWADAYGRGATSIPDAKPSAPDTQVVAAPNPRVPPAPSAPRSGQPSPTPGGPPSSTAPPSGTQDPGATSPTAPPSSPSTSPSTSPTPPPSGSPSPTPTASPTAAPTGSPTTAPTSGPTASPTASPSCPSGSPSASPSPTTPVPSPSPGTCPSPSPSPTPSSAPSSAPSPTRS